MGRVPDLGCGDGATAMPEAKMGAHVQGDAIPRHGPCSLGRTLDFLPALRNFKAAQSKMKRSGLSPLGRALAVASVFLFGAQLSAADAPATGTPAIPQGHYKNFDVAVYIPAAVVKTFAEPGRLESEWKRISEQLKVDKVYIETHRDREVVDEGLIETVKKFFTDRGVRIAGGITFTDKPTNFIYSSFCYTDPADREFVKKVSELTARHFDEFILDDFTFVTTKRESDVAAKGNRSWTDFRLELMDDVTRNLIVGPAKAVNPKVKVTIKYPNWYEHFQAMGFDLDQGPKIFDGIYTGTETRDPNGTAQFLQQYESYEIIRYFENIAPGRNGGGWVDTFGTRYADRYAEQLWDTMFAKAREITLFFWQGIQQPIELGDRGAWQSLPTTFNSSAMMKHVNDDAGAAEAANPLWARAAGYALDQADAIVGQLGNPIGIASYRPPHGLGEDFLHNYIGMMGIPIEMRPTFPEGASVVLLTEDAKDDPAIVDRIKRQLNAGKTVIITSGLYTSLHGKGIEDIVELEVSPRRFIADNFSTGFFPSARDIVPDETIARKNLLFPQIAYITNDAWPQATAMSDGVGYPILLMDIYGKSGRLFVWTIPDNQHQLYDLPLNVTSAIKNVVMTGFPVRLDGPSQVALFAYDNDTAIVESYRPEPETVTVSVFGSAQHLRDLTTGEIINPRVDTHKPSRWEIRMEKRTAFEVQINPHSFRGFKIEK
jgi:hypothetical protein